MTHPVKWTPEMDAKLIRLWPHMNSHDIADIIGVGKKSAWDRAQKLKLGTSPRRPRTEPPREVWIRVATAEAEFRGVKPKDVLSGRRYRKAAVARWHAFKATLEMCPTASIAGLARVAGFDHSSVIHGLCRLKEIREAA